jgi:hypothetical protein
MGELHDELLSLVLDGDPNADVEPPEEPRLAREQGVSV